jgi:hypothetical protein
MSDGYSEPDYVEQANDHYEAKNGLGKYDESALYRHKAFKLSEGDKESLIDMPRERQRFLDDIVDFYELENTSAYERAEMMRRMMEANAEAERFAGCDGCSTDDCPHRNPEDCIQAQGKIIARQAAEIASMESNPRDVWALVNKVCDDAGIPAREPPTGDAVPRRMLPQNRLATLAARLQAAEERERGLMEAMKALATMVPIVTWIEEPCGRLKKSTSPSYNTQEFARQAIVKHSPPAALANPEAK